jgi:uncharacterized protein (UPF0276 family)
MSGALDDIPFLGSGIGYRRQIGEALKAQSAEIDFFEIVSEQFLNSPSDLEELEEISDRTQCIPHGLSLSVGSAEPAPTHYLAAIRELLRITKAPYYSEHLAITHVPGIEIGHLSPIQRTREALKITVGNVNRAQDVLGVPLILENVTYPFELPGAELSEPAFLTEIVERTGCGMLLDVTNLRTNSVNHKFDAIKVLEDLPLSQVVQIHLAGGYWHGDTLIDGHCAEIEEGTWSLLDALLERVPVRGSILEHDADFPNDVGVLIDQLGRARSALERAWR